MQEVAELFKLISLNSKQQSYLDRKYAKTMYG